MRREIFPKMLKMNLKQLFRWEKKWILSLKMMFIKLSWVPTTWALKRTFWIGIIVKVMPNLLHIGLYCPIYTWFCRFLLTTMLHVHTGMTRHSGIAMLSLLSGNIDSQLGYSTKLLTFSTFIFLLVSILVFFLFKPITWCILTKMK